jgi:transcriptional regulator with XRE-family HTH domain
VHYARIGRYEEKGAQPSADVLAKLANALDVTADYHMDGSVNDKAQSTISDKELLSQFLRVEKLPSDKKAVVKELVDAFLLKTDLQQKLTI